MELKPINPADITVEELRFLERSTDADYVEERPLDVVTAAINGKAIIWRFTGDEGEKGVLVTQGLKQAGGLELRVWHMGGEGFHKNSEFIFGELEKHAEKYGFRWIVGQAVRGVAWVLKKRLGFDQKTVLVVKEVGHG
jgi:hypothetical protein